MRIYLNENVIEAARKRVAFIFDNFENVVVGMSGGKDSTVVFNLCIEEATKRGRLPLPVLWIDQEAEWQHTADYMKWVMYRKDVKPYWLQCPIRLFNATSHESDNWLHCWYDGEPWMREKDPISIHENVFGTDRFEPMYSHFLVHTFGEDNACIVGGVRADESPARARSVSSSAKYKYVTWGKHSDGAYSFYPIYDWALSDVWHAIQKNHWKYNRIYDEFYRYGLNPNKMRVSNLNHETAVSNLYYVQEIEPKTWNKLVARMNGINTTSKIDYKDNFMCPKELPFMFKDWPEYRDYLLEKIVVDPKQRETFRKRFARADRNYIGDRSVMHALYKTEITCILANDYTFTKLKNFEVSNSEATLYRNIRKGKKITTDSKAARKIKGEIDEARD